MSQYSADISKPINFLPVNIAIFAVVPLPQNGSRTTSPLFDQDKMWSFAKRSGNTAGCFVLFNPLATSHTLKRLEYSLTTLFLDKVRRCSLPLLVSQLETFPALLFSCRTTNLTFSDVLLII